MNERRSGWGLYGVTALARPLDLRRPSNRLAAVATAVFVVAGTIWSLGFSDASFPGAVGFGLRVGLGAFLAWALGREVDPDRVRTARYAVFASILLAFLGAPALATAVALLLAARIVLRPTGLPLRTADLLGAVVVTGFAVAGDATGVPAALVLAGALAADKRLNAGASHPFQLHAATATVVVTFTGAWLAGTLLETWNGPRWDDLVVLVLTAVAVTQLPTGGIRAQADATGEPLPVDRVEHARLTVFLGVLGAVLWTGFDAVTASWPALAALLGGGMTGVVVRRTRRPVGRPTRAG